jgi:hypothetical protein
MNLLQTLRNANETNERPLALRVKLRVVVSAFNNGVVVRGGVKDRVCYRLRGAQQTLMYRNLVHCKVLMLAKVYEAM